MQKIIKSLIIIVIIALASAISYQLGKEAEKNPIKIGAIIPLTGDLAKYGKAMQNTLFLALENYPGVEIIIEDDHSCDSKEAATAAQKLLSLDKVSAIIGAICSSPTLSVSPLAERAKTIMISPSASSPSISKAGDYVFRVIASDELKSVEVAMFAFDRGYRKAAFLTDIANDSFLRQKQDLEKSFTELGGEIVADESFKTKDVDFKTQLMKIKESDVEVVLLSAFYKEGALVLKQAGELGISLPFMTSETSMEDYDLIAVAGEAAEGLIYPFATAPDNPEHVDFVNAYKEKYGEEPLAYCAETYDAFMLAMKAIEQSNGEKEDIKERLYEVGQNYKGASGVITFDENGDVQKPFIIKTIRNGEFVPY